MNLILKLFSFKTILDACFSWLFRITVPDDYFWCLFQMPISDDFSRWLFQMTVGCLRITVSDYCSRWIFRMLVSNDFFGWLFVSTTDSCFSGQSIFPRSIPISTYHSTDWSHDWFVFERRLPTAELWPRSPLIKKRSSLEISQNSRENTYVRVSFCQGLKPATLLKKGSGTGDFLWILRNF